MKIFLPMIHPLVGARADASGSLTWVQDPKALGCPRLLSQGTSRELDGKWRCWGEDISH